MTGVILKFGTCTRLRDKVSLHSPVLDTYFTQGPRDDFTFADAEH